MLYDIEFQLYFFMSYRFKTASMGKIVNQSDKPISTLYFRPLCRLYGYPIDSSMHLCYHDEVIFGL